MVPFGGAPEVIARLAGAVVAIGADFPVREPETSVAVIVWLPVLSAVAKKFPIPLGSVELGGRRALASLLVKWTVPA